MGQVADSLNKACGRQDRQAEWYQCKLEVWEGGWGQTAHNDDREVVF